MAWYRCGNPRKISYISSTGTQQLNLPVYMDEGVVIKTKMLLPSTIFPNVCSIINDEWNVNSMALYVESGQLALRYNTTSVILFDSDNWKWVDIEFDTSNGSLVYGGVTYGGSGGNYNHKIIQLFGLDESKFSLVSFQDIDIYKHGSLYIHLEPRKDQQTGDGYFYDTIGEQSYYSATNTPLIYNEMD